METNDVMSRDPGGDPKMEPMKFLILVRYTINIKRKFAFNKPLHTKVHKGLHYTGAFGDPP